jgi:hypothetical protein
MAALEAALAEALLKIVDNKDIADDGIIVTNTAYNLQPGQTGGVVNVESTEDIDFDMSLYNDNYVQRNITFQVGGVAIKDVFDIPVVISVPIPVGMDMDMFRILHFVSGLSEEPMVIRPALDRENRRAVFVLYQFSEFVYAELAVPKIGAGLGDVDGDGVIDSADVTLLRRFIAQTFADDTARNTWIAANGFVLANANVDGSAEYGDYRDIDAFDVTLLRQWIAAYQKFTLGVVPPIQTITQ